MSSDFPGKLLTKPMGRDDLVPVASRAQRLLDDEDGEVPGTHQVLLD